MNIEILIALIVGFWVGLFAMWWVWFVSSNGDF